MNRLHRDKVVKEYQENVDKGVDMTEVNNFPYMRAVTRETNRRYGSAMHIRYVLPHSSIVNVVIIVHLLSCVEKLSRTFNSASFSFPKAD